MFRFFRPRLPLSTFSRVDLELLMRRNIDVIGREHVLSAEIITDVRQLGLDAGSPEALIRSANAEVSRRMRVPQSEMEVAIEHGSDFDQATRYVAGTAGAPARLLIRREVTEDPMRTVMELAYGYAYHFWLRHPAPRPLDTHPRTTHLMPVCMGLGVLASTTALKESHWSASGFSGWSMSRSGYYSPLEIGYALALWARARGEVDPQWLSFLRLDSRSIAREAAKSFVRHQAGGGQRLFDAVSIPGTDRSPLELVRWLAGTDPDFAMAAAYALAKLEHLPDAAVDAALARTYGKDLEMVVLATRLLAAAPPGTAPVESRIHELVQHRSGPIALAALHAASGLGVPMQPFAARVVKLLRDPSLDLIPLTDVISKHAEAFAPLSPVVRELLSEAVRAEDEEAIAALRNCLSALSDDPREPKDSASSAT